MERKLTAILCADVFGYSRLMGQDEEATIRTLSAHRAIIDGLIEQHRGRFVNSAGDSVLAEFASVVNAVECAVEIQAALKAEDARLPSERRMEFRIGVNLGDAGSPQKLDDRHAARAKRLYSWCSPLRTECATTRLERSKQCLWRCRGTEKFRGGSGRPGPKEECGRPRL